MTSPFLEDPLQCARAIVEHVGRDLRVAVPIGVGKPIALLDALYRLAQTDPTLKLSIFTGLSLTRPPQKTLLAARFVGPLLDRTLGSYAEPLYVGAQRANALPKNIAVHDFFLQAGVWTNNAGVQQAYTSLNYAHVGQHLQRLGTNVLAQAVAPAPDNSPHVSLSSNTDIALDLLDYVAQCRERGQAIAVVGEIHPQLPFMGGDAVQPFSAFDYILKPGDVRDLFSVPKEPVTLQDYAMALHAATLVKDGGMLQIGIGTFSDALTHVLVLRHQHNDLFRALLAKLGRPLHREAELTPFVEGLYGCTELFVDGYLTLMRAGILKREAEDRQGHARVLDAGFLLGNRAFYRALSDLNEVDRDRIVMRGISFTNTLQGDTESKVQARRDARFINSGMVATLLGAVSSDATQDGRVVSGVGGQLDLVLQAHQLPNARAIMVVRSHRRAPFKTHSNIVWTYGNCTVPRSLRDIVVTEYGVADLRGKSDRDTVAEMIAVADTEFQPGLMKAAKRAGKLEPGYQAPERANSAELLERQLAPFRRDGTLPLFPHGTEMTVEERGLVEPLADLAGLTIEILVQMLGNSFGAIQPDEVPTLARLGLDHPSSLKERMLQRLVLGAIRRRRNLAAREGTDAITHG